MQYAIFFNDLPPYPGAYALRPCALVVCPARCVGVQVTGARYPVLVPGGR